MELETVLYRVEGSVAVISLNRTKAMNSLNKQIFADLTTAFEAAKADEAVRVVVMNGEGRAFCAGGDIAEMKSINRGRRLHHPAQHLPQARHRRRPWRHRRRRHLPGHGRRYRPGG